jgi:CubicO group peptidase (beta-lactamase class C family)
MTTGLDDGVLDNHCTLDTCLNYLADPGTRWAYHNAPYTLLESVLVNATGLPINTFTQQKLKLPTGITGSWFTVDYDNVFFSKARSMARFGLLIQNKGIWNNDTLLNDTAYFNQMVNTSQNINYSYGYLWWLNGKASYMLPTVQNIFSGSYAPDAPADMFAGLGKNGQILSIAPSKGLVVIRMGNQPGTNSDVPTVFCNQIWQKLNAVMCNTASANLTNQLNVNLVTYPNPIQNGVLNLSYELTNKQDVAVDLYDIKGQLIIRLMPQQTRANGKNTETLMLPQSLSAGQYVLRITAGNYQKGVSVVVE